MTVRGFARFGLVVALAGAATGLARGTAGAQDGPFAGTTIEVAAHGGYIFFDEGGTRPALGGRAGIRLANGLGFGAAVDRATREFELGDETDHGESLFWAGEVSYVIPSATRANFFGFIGFGQARYEPSELEESLGGESADHLLIPLGLGMLWYNHGGAPWWGLRAEFRDHIVHIDADESTGADDATTNNYQLSLGLIFLLGGGPQPVN